MVRQGREALLAEEHRHFIDFLARQAVDDTGITATFCEERQQLLARLLLGHDTIEDIRPVEARQEALCILQVQAVDNLFASALVGGGGQGNSRHIWKQFCELSQLQVFGAEIMAPLRDAMRLVDGEQGDIQAAQEVEHARLHQTLRRQVQHLDLAVANLHSQVTLLLGAQRGVQGSGSHAQLFEGSDLVVHQGDQWRNHHGQAIAQQGRDLEAQGLAAAGGHQHQGVATIGHALDNGTLTATETVVAEDVLKDALSLFEHRNSKNRRTILATGWMKTSLTTSINA
ncbi:hypothetical protein D9M71_57560 [compost metagenome]